MPRIFSIIFLSLLAATCYGQYKWELEKDKDGIKIYSSYIEHSSFKAIKAECTLNGSYAKLISILTNPSQYHDWIYHAKSSRMLKLYSTYDFVYYLENEAPWPLSNRDAAIHLKMRTDSLSKFLSVTEIHEPDLIPASKSNVRIKHFVAYWRVTMPTPQTINIYYQLEVDPGGNIPGWVANLFVDKGAWETFSNLAKKLKE